MANGQGGARIGAGRKKKALADNIADGNPGKRKLTVLDFTDTAADLEGQSARLGCAQRSAGRLADRLDALVYRGAEGLRQLQGCFVLENVTMTVEFPLNDRGPPVLRRGIPANLQHPDRL